MITESGHMEIQAVAMGWAERNPNSMDCGLDCASQMKWYGWPESGRAGRMRRKMTGGGDRAN
jgi:hypothetical protein